MGGAKRVFAMFFICFGDLNQNAGLYHDIIVVVVVVVDDERCVIARLSIVKGAQWRNPVFCFGSGWFGLCFVSE